MKLLSFTSSETNVTEYLESVSKDGVTGTIDKERAIQFFDDKVPVTTVILQFPILERLYEAPQPAERPTVSEINLRHVICH